MRQVLFAVVLIGASFLGGTFVNGPGLKWLQVKVLGHASTSDEDIPSVTLPIAAASDEDSGSGGSPPRSPSMAESPALSSKASAKTKGPSPLKIAGTPPPAKPAEGAPKPEPDPASGSKSGLSNVLGSLLSLGDTAAAGQPAPSASSPPAAKSVNPAETPRAMPPFPEPPKSPTIALASRRAKAAGPVPEAEMPAPGRPAPLDPSVTPAFLASLTTDSPTTQVPVTQASASSEPRALPLPIPLTTEEGAANPANPSTTPDPSPVADEWGAIRQKLRALGVTRYTIEGEPGGRVSFSCLIPMAGRQAVTQRFEAEGDDEIRAARAALRRIALWQATERDRSPR